MSAHTPGPWTINERHGGTTVLIGASTVAIAYDPEEPTQASETAKANARLIAAAPELLAALQLGLLEAVTLKARLPEPYRSNIEAFVASARAAIAKAEGR